MDDAQVVKIPVTLLQSVSVYNMLVGFAARMLQQSSKVTPYD